MSGVSLVMHIYLLVCLIKVRCGGRLVGRRREGTIE